jgi:hypothetical protein
MSDSEFYGTAMFGSDAEVWHGDFELAIIPG